MFWVFASAGTVEEASQAVDVVIYLTGADLGPGSEYRARTVLKGIFARIGIRMLRWATLLAMAGNDDCPMGYLEAALQRARMCELLAGAQGGSGPEGYIIGCSPRWIRCSTRRCRIWCCRCPLTTGSSARCWSAKEC